VVGAGAAEGSLDAANMLKPLLARGELHAIGATTIDEYRKYIEKDKALERRFQPVLIDEPTVEDTISILRGLRDRFEQYHKVRIRDGAIVAAAKLSARYITDRFLPDKAIDLIDEAASRLQMELTSRPEELDEVSRRLGQLRVEQAALKKEKDKESTERLARIEQEAPEGALTREKAVELAWDRFLRDVPDARRADFEVVNATFHSLPQEHAAWWLVRVMHKNAPIGGAAYDMAVLLPDGDRVVTGDSAAFSLDMKAQQEVQRLRALEAERGPFTVWSKEQKADFYPQFYRLPGEGDVSEEQAVSIARKALNERFGVTEEALDALQALFEQKFYEE